MNVVMQEAKFTTAAYAIFLGLLLSVFAGFGIATFYQAPSAPTFPEEVNPVNEPDQERQQRDWLEYQERTEQHQSGMEGYHRDVSIISLVIAVFLVGAGLLLSSKIKVLADGLLLGGIFTLLYSIGRSFAAEDAAHSFVTLAIALAVVGYLGYNRFVKSPDK